jgi:GAF domain-containing protein
MAVGDLQQDARFHGNVHCCAGTRAYLTAPLVASNGHRLGAVCFVDPQPRKCVACG